LKRGNTGVYFISVGACVEKEKNSLTEKEIQTQIEGYLRVTGWMVMPEPHRPRNPRYNYVGTKGRSDILALKKGQFMAIEIKKPGGVISKEQEEFIGDVIRHGGLGFFAFSLEDVTGRV
jgi:Holliday junction resolvase